VGSVDLKPEQQSSKPLLPTDWSGAYAAGVNGGAGHLLFLRDATLFAQPFDPDRLELSGVPVPVADQVSSFVGSHAGQFSASETGVLAYRVGTGGNLSQLTWLDSQGTVMGTVGERGAYRDPRLSPDGTRIAVSQLDSQTGNSNIWVVNTTRGTNTRLTFNSGADRYPVWSPDGTSIIFASNQAGHFDLYQKLADGSGEQTLLLKSEHDKRPWSWSRDGFLVYDDVDPKPRSDIWVLRLSDRKPISFLRTEFNETQGAFSPDGRWIAYVSGEFGATDVYIRPFSPDKPVEPTSGGKWMISTKGGGASSSPRWRADGKELFYTQGGIRQMAVEVVADKTFQAGTPRRLFDFGVLLSGSTSRPDGTGDGGRFLFVSPEGANAQTPITIVTNWQAELKK
jgi:Tol biopolymer transport system component